MTKSLLVATAISLSLGVSTPQAFAQDSQIQVDENTAQSADETAEQAKTYSAAAFFETKSFSLGNSNGHGFSKDGSKLILNSDETGVFNAMALNVAGETAGDRSPLTNSTTNGTFAQSWFPNDNRVIVEADQGGNELDHVYVRDEDGKLTDLTPGEKLKASFVGWRNDGQLFYISSNERDPQVFDIYAYQTDTLKRELIFKNPGMYPSAMTADGKFLALVKPVSSADSDVYIADLTKADSAPVLVTPHTGNIAHTAFAFTPDGSSLVYGTNADSEFIEARAYNIATGETAPMLKADWDVQFLFYSPSGRYRISAVNADAVSKLEILDSKTGKPLNLTGVPDAQIGQVRFNRDEKMIAFNVNSDTSPSNIYIADLATGKARRMTDALNPEIDEADLVTAEVVRYKSFDGLEIPSILYLPKGANAANPAPALVWVHGGPGGQSTKGYSATIQHLVNHGYAVLAANNRGSSGYGKTFFHMDDKRHGEDDLKDIVAARGYLAGLDAIDGSKVAVIGGSYGGYMTAAALAFHPEAFDAGVNIFGVTNWVRTLKSIPPWWGAQKDALYDEMGDPATDEERHRRISPLFHASNIVKPMLVIQGANDPRVLQVESDELVAAARKGGATVEYVLFPDEGHGFLKKSNRITASDAYLKFLDTHLKGLSGALAE